MRTALLLVLVIGSCAAAARAQYPAYLVHSRDVPLLSTAQPSGYRDHSSSETRKLGKELALSADQRAAVQPILADRLRRIYAAMNDGSLAWRERRAQRSAIVAETDGRLAGLLDVGQRARFEQLESRRTPVASSVEIVGPSWQ